MRLAIVQHGDFHAARQRFAAGGPEKYFAQRRSVEAISELIKGHQALVVSLDADNRYDVRVRDGRSDWRLVSLPSPEVRRGRSVAEIARAARLTALMAALRPTHLLLRSSVPFVCHAALGAARAFGARTAVMFLSALAPERRAVRQPLQRLLVDALQADNVELVANYCRPATQSLVELGLPAHTVKSYAHEGMRTPADRPPRTTMRVVPRVAFFGMMQENKGPTDLLDAALLLHARERPTDLHMYGDGPERAAIEARGAALPTGSVTFHGRVSVEECFHAMCDADFVVVPSRHDFGEGMPLALTDALSSRAVVLCSDHPVFTKTYRDGEGLLFFQAANPPSLAAALERVMDDPALYASLSAGADKAYARIGANDTTFEKLIVELAQRWS